MVLGHVHVNYEKNNVFLRHSSHIPSYASIITSVYLSISRSAHILFFVSHVVITHVSLSLFLFLSPFLYLKTTYI